MSIVADLKRTEAKATTDNESTTIQQTAGKYLHTKKLVFEQVQGQKFYLSNGKTATQITDMVNGQEVIYAPISEGNVNWNISQATPIQPVDKKKLWNFTKQFIYNNVELPDERLYEVLTAWTFATWLTEAWQTVPYVFFVGIKNSGKTQALEVLQQLCFRAKISVSTSAPALFRSIEKYGCIPFLDESETLNQEEKGDIIACLNGGYKRSSGKVERCQGDGGNQDIKTFQIFGFKAIAGTKALVATLESRSIIINMAKNTRNLDTEINTTFAEIIRNGLLQWRFETILNNSIPLIHDNPESSHQTYDAYDAYDACDASTKQEETTPKELLAITNRRVRELFKPLCKVADEDKKQIIIEYASTVANQQKTEENTSTDSEILIAILECHDLVEKGFLPRTVIENTYNKDKPEKERLYDKTLTNKIKALGLEYSRTAKGRGFIWNTKILRALCERFGFECDSYLPKDNDASPLLEASYPSQASQPSQPTPSKLPSLDQVVSCTVLEAYLRRFNTVCPRCSEQHDTLYQITYYNGTIVNVCMECGSQILEYLQRKDEMEHQQ